jgi:hypothetical protein
MRTFYDPDRDEVTIYFGEKRQSYDHGGTSLVMTQPLEVQIGFEGESELIFISIRPASQALPGAFLEAAELRRT